MLDSDVNDSLDSTLTIVTSNIRYGTASDGANSWPHRRDMLCDTLRSLDADVIGLQEALYEPLQFISDALPDYSVIGVGRIDGRREGEWAAILVRDTRLETRRSGTFWLSETPDVVGSRGWDAAFHARICTWAELQDRETGTAFLVLNSHWDNEGILARQHSAGLIAAWLQAHAEGLPAILMGDFNDTPNSVALRYLCGQDASLAASDTYPPSPELADSFLAGGIPEAAAGTFHGFGGRTDGERIDYLLTTPTVEVLDYRIVHDSREGRFPSDHFPVAIRVRL